MDDDNPKSFQLTRLDGYGWLTEELDDDRLKYPAGPAPFEDE